MLLFIKLTNLAGTYFSNKDKKKGQQDSLQVYMQHTFGYLDCFPDTSNTHYGSNCAAAGELMDHQLFYCQYLQLVRDLKEKRTFTNIEKNIYEAFNDIPTCTELCVLILYAQAISHPYIHLACGTNSPTQNALDMGPVYENVKTHLCKIIADPKLLISPSASWETGSLDGKPWENPEYVYVVLQEASWYPHH